MRNIIEIALQNAEEEIDSEVILDPYKLYKNKHQVKLHPEDILELPLNVKKSTWNTFHEDGHTLIAKTFHFKSDKHLLYFLNEVIRKSNEMNHHPKLIVEYQKITVESFTHDINDVTELDIDLTRYADEVYEDIVYLSEI